jgi:UDP-GlcNAc:undecaprenyl-phosphate GlcNAc-1-phosphate transferase
MSSFILAFFISFLICYVLTPFVRKLNILDIPAEEKIHDKPMPKAGGLAIFAGVMAAVWMLSGAIGLKDVILLTFFASAMCLLGLNDDIFGIGPEQKFLVQGFVGMLMALYGYRAGYMHYYISLPITVLWVAGVTNAVNLQDGMDGLASGMCLFSSLCFSFMGYIKGDMFLCLIGLATAGACLGFLKYNFHPAAIFMGDTGSMFLGFMLSFMGILLARTATNYLELFIPVVILAVPIGDTLASILRRIFVRKGMFSADRRHFYDLLMDKTKLSYDQVVLIGYLFSLLAGVGAICLI